MKGKDDGARSDVELTLDICTGNAIQSNSVKPDQQQSRTRSLISPAVVPGLGHVQ